MNIENECFIEGISKEEYDKILNNQNEYDNHLKIILSKINRLELLIEEIDGIKEIKEIKEIKNNKPIKGLITKMIDTTSYIHSIIDNTYFVGKIILPLWVYYTVTK